VVGLSKPLKPLIISAIWSIKIQELHKRRASDDAKFRCSSYILLSGIISSIHGSKQKAHFISTEITLKKQKNKRQLQL